MFLTVARLALVELADVAVASEVLAAYPRRVGAAPLAQPHWSLAHLSVRGADAVGARHAVVWVVRAVSVARDATVPVSAQRPIRTRPGVPISTLAANWDVVCANQSALKRHAENAHQQKQLGKHREVKVESRKFEPTQLSVHRCFVETDSVESVEKCGAGEEGWWNSPLH